MFVFVTPFEIVSASARLDLELSDEDAPLKSPMKKGNGRRALSAYMYMYFMRMKNRELINGLSTWRSTARGD
jgi:hypothetical protein